MREDHVPGTCEHEARTAAGLQQANHLDSFIKVANHVSIMYFSVVEQKYRISTKNKFNPGFIYTFAANSRGIFK